VSIQDVRPSSRNNSSSEPSAPFSPPNYAVWVNSLWFLSLAISLTCALLATLLQQWARRYIKITQPRYSPHKRAHIRAFFAEGVDKLHLPLAVDALPLLLHLSLILFFAGLVVFLFNINHTVFGVVASWIGLCMAVYVWITFVPMFRHDSPYYTPLSSSSWFLVNGSLYVLCGVIQWLTSNSCFSSATWYRFYKLKEHFYAWAQCGLGKVAQETAQKVSPKIGGRALKWTLESLDEDHELERFFAGIPGICSSTVVEDPLVCYIKPIADKMSAALMALVHRTLSSNIISESVKQQRIVICKEAMKVASLPINQRITRRVFHGEWSGLLDSVEFGFFLRTIYSDPYTAYHAQCMISIIIAGVEERDDRWSELVSGHLDMPSSVLRDYLAHGDSVLLANCVHVIRLMVQSYSTHCWAHEPDSVSKTLESVTKFDVRRSRPEVQREFCVLWNEAVLLAQKTKNLDTRLLLNDILWVLGHIHIDLHKGSNASTRPREIVWGIPWSYPLCDVETRYGCQSDSTSHTHEGVETPEVSPRSPSYQLGASSTTIPPHAVTSAPSSPRLEPGDIPASGLQLSSDSPRISSSDGNPALQVFTEFRPSSHENDLGRSNTRPVTIDAASRFREVVARSMYGEPDGSNMLSALSVTLPIPAQFAES